MDCVYAPEFRDRKEESDTMSLALSEQKKREEKCDH